MNTTPIEFMAWDKEERCFIPQEKLTDPYELNYIYLINSNSYGFMQLTSLRSINDEQPIYNHMIVRDSLGNLHEVDMFNYPLMSWLSRFELEIVGNRFQHHELLKLCK